MRSSSTTLPTCGLPGCTCARRVRLTTALPRIREAIQRFAAAAGASQKYRETITVVWMRLLEDAGTQVTRPCELSELLRLRPEFGDKNLPLKYYSRDHLFSDQARTTFVPADLPPRSICRPDPG